MSQSETALLILVACAFLMALVKPTLSYQSLHQPVCGPSARAASRACSLPFWHPCWYWVCHGLLLRVLYFVLDPLLFFTIRLISSVLLSIIRSVVEFVFVFFFFFFSHCAPSLVGCLYIRRSCTFANSHLAFSTPSLSTTPFETAYACPSPQRSSSTFHGSEIIHTNFIINQLSL